MTLTILNEDKYIFSNPCFFFKSEKDAVYLGWGTTTTYVREKKPKNKYLLEF